MESSPPPTLFHGGAKVVLVMIIAVAIVAQFNRTNGSNRTPKVGNCFRGQVATGQFESRSISCDTKATEGVAIVRITQVVKKPNFSTTGKAYLRDFVVEVCRLAASTPSSSTDHSADSVKIGNHGVLKMAESSNKTNLFCFERVDPQ
jgi:hypothetical protein